MLLQSKDLEIYHQAVSGKMKLKLQKKKKQYQRLDKVYEFHTKEGNETINKYDKKQILRKYKRLYLYVADI